MNVPNRIKKLTETFDYNLEMYKKGSYNETQVRREFIDPFFEELGWDITNKQGHAEAYKEVIHEDAIKIGGITKAPDYCFRIGGTRKFFLEAKKPAVNIKEDIHPAYQLRRYGWSAKLPLSILTDFEEFAVYDCRAKPAKTDKVSHSRILYMRYTDYIERWDELVNIFSPNAILKGSFDKYVASKKTKKGTAEVDKAFLAEIERWRELLARNIALRNPNLTQRELNFAVQQTIDRVVFLRICEDRGIENYGRLMALKNGNNVYKRLFQLFRKADEKYNSGLFHFKKEKSRENFDNLTPNLIIDDKELKSIFKNLYYPDSPYEFSVLPADILGRVYEQFLGKIIRLTPKHQAKIEEKPEVRKAGGVYYTPTYIVNYIVKQTVGKLVENKKPGPRGAVSKLKILDPACGSGSFLLGAYQYLLDWHRDQYVNDDPEKWAKGKTPRLYQTYSGEWRLTTDERKRILLNNIYGVDIDPQAVEVTKLSLLLKVLEGEDEQSIGKQMALFQERVLPDLANNIKCGNSLIGPDFYENQQMSIFEEEEMYRVNAFDWDAEFPEIMVFGGFDAAIGNPPYLGRSTTFLDIEKQYINSLFNSSEGKYELYHLFLEKGVRLIKNNGYLSYITPQTWLSIKQATKLRKLLLGKTNLLKIVSIRQKIFDVSVDNVISLFQFSNKSQPIKIFEIKNSDNFIEKVKKPINEIDQTYIKNTEEAIIDVYFNKNKSDISDKIKNNSKELSAICYAKDGIKVVGKAKEFAFAKEKYSASFFPMIVGRNIDKYYLKWGGLFCCRDKEQIEKHNATDIRLREEFIFKRPKILIRKTGREIIAAWDDNEYYYEQSLFSISKQDSDSKIDLKYILGILNSKLSSYLLRINPFSKKDTFPQIRLHWLKNFPLKKIDFSNPSDKASHDRMVALVDQMLNLNKKLNSAKLPQEKNLLKRQIEAADKQIDQLVYELYDLTEEEIKIVESET